MKNQNFRLVVLFLAIAFSFVSFASEENKKGHKTEVIFYNAKIFTSDLENPWAEAVYIKNDKIKKVGTNEEVLRKRKSDTVVYNLEGRVVIPGFNDSHTHALWTRRNAEFVNSSDFLPGPGPTLSEIIAAIEAKAATTPPGTWLFGSIGTNVLDDPNANRYALDTVSPNHPVKLTSWAGHGTLLNTAGLNAAGISQEADDPPAGFYGRMEGTNILNGFLHEYAEHLLTRFLKQQIPVEEARQTYLNYANAVARFGTTSIQDMAVGYTLTESEEILGGVDLPIRWRVFCFPLEVDDECSSNMPRKGPDRLTSSGIKWISDGSPVERFALLSDEYSDLPNWFGLFNFPNQIDSLLARSQNGNRHQNQMVFHAVGDQAIQMLLDGLDRNDHGEPWHRRRVRIEHGDLLQPHQFDAMERHQVILVQNPLHFALPDTLHQRFGAERFEVLQPMKSVIEAGIPLVIASDFTQGPANPFLDLMFAVLHPTNPSEALTMEEAVRAYTWGGAFAEFQEDKKGTIEKNMYADLAILSQDIFTADIFSLPGTTSLLTMVGGEIVWDSGALTPEP